MAGGFRAVAAYTADVFGLFPIFPVGFVVLFVRLVVLQFRMRAELLFQGY